jgi:hypothetical protein
MPIVIKRSFPLYIIYVQTLLSGLHFRYAFDRRTLPNHIPMRAGYQTYTAGRKASTVVVSKPPSPNEWTFFTSWKLNGGTDVYNDLLTFGL